MSNEPDATEEKIHACGTMWDNDAGEYYIVTVNVRTDAIDVDDLITIRMNPAITEDINPDIYYSDDRYLVWWQLANKEIYML